MTTETKDIEAERHQRTLEGLADVNAGRVVDHSIILETSAATATRPPLRPASHPKKQLN